MSDILCARRKCLSDARETVYLETVDGKLLEVNACTNHVDSLRRYIPGFNVVEKGMCVVSGCKEPRKSKGCCENHYQHVKQWKLTNVATDFVAYDLTAAEYVTFTGIMRKLDEDKIDKAIQEEPTMTESNCPDVTEASPVDVECEEVPANTNNQGVFCINLGNHVWRRSRALVPVRLLDERAAEIVRLEQENTALREQLAKVEQQTSVFVLDESDLRRRYNNMILGEQTVRELDGGAYVTVKLNNVEVHIDEFEVDRIKRRLRERAEKQISDALRLDVTVTPKDALFYLVWSPDGRTPPHYKHYSLEEAKKAANQMKSIHGGDFYAVAVIGDVSDKKDDIPF